MIKELIFLMLISFTTCNLIRTQKISMNEELDSDTQIANLTQLIQSILNKTIPIKSIKFNQQSDLNDYFKLENKQISFNTQVVNSIDLKTSSKRFDRETVCATTTSQTTSDCLLVLKLIARLEDSIDLEVDLPLQINDINDNKPAFYQPEIKIDIDLNKPQQLIKIPLKLAYDLDSTRENRIQNYSLSKSFNNQIQIKYNQRSLILIINTTDLNVNKTELIELKALDPDYETTQLIEINFQLKPKFELFESKFYNLTQASNLIRLKLNKTTNQLCDPIEFSVYNVKTNKPIRAEFKQLNESCLDVNLAVRLNHLKLVAKCGDLNDTVYLVLNDVLNTSVFNLNLVSAMNDLDINETNNMVEFKFKNTDALINDNSSIIRPSNNNNQINSSFVTLAYLIAEQQPQLYTTNVKYKLNRQINKLDDNYHDLIKIDEMRNGLYALKISTKYLDTIKLLNNQNVDKRSMSSSVQYTLRLNLLVNEPDLTIQRMIKLNLPSLHLIQTNTDLTVTATRKNTQNQISITAASFVSNFNLFNSVVLITIISVVLILIALGCFIISLSLYLKSKCKQAKEINTTKDDLIGKLNEKKLYNLTGSSSIELGSGESGISSGQPSSASSTSDLSSNNSTITTATHNAYNHTNRTSWVANNNSNNAIMVYDVMPSKSNQSSSVSSSSASSNYQNSSNISPVTTTSGVESALSNSSSIHHNNKQSLLQLSAKNLDSDYESNNSTKINVQNSKDVMYKWYMNTSNELIRPLPVKPQSNNTNDDTCDPSLNNDYRNEIYRNSHIIFKNNTQYCQLKKNLPVLAKRSDDLTTESTNKTNNKNEDIKTYEAKPIHLNSSCSRDIYSTNSNTNANNINSSSSLDNYDTVNFDSLSTNSINFLNSTRDNNISIPTKMFNRLSTANSITSSENSSHINHLNHHHKILNTNYVKTNLSMIDSEQQISSV